jgi:5'-nucleotidase
MMRRASCLTALAVAAFLAGACGGNSGNDQQDGAPQDDAVIHQWDANHPQQDATPQQDTGPVTCLATTDYGAAGALDGYIDPDSALTDYVYYEAMLNADSSPDVLQIWLYNGFGVFTNGIKKGTYDLTGDETNWETCGACVLVLADVNTSTGEAKQTYLATGGQITITELGPRLIGSLSNVTLTRVTISDVSPYPSTPTGDCDTALTSAGMDNFLAATATFKIIGLTDFHGQLDPIGAPGTLKGGAAALATYVANERDSCTLVVGAGDQVGASPPLSSYFNEEPSVKALNLIGLDAATLGNHEFDKGITALNSLIALAEFDYVAANLNELTANLPDVLAPYVVYDFAGIKVAVIGITDTDLATVTTPANLGTLTVMDQATTITAVQAARTAAAGQGATIFIGIFHAGASTATTGQLFDIANGLTGFDAIIGGHTHFPDVSGSTTAGTVVLQPAIAGQSYARVSLTVNTTTGAVTARNGEIVQAITASVTPNAGVVTMLSSYRTDLAPIMDPVAGEITAAYPQDGYTERLAESALGDLLADAMRAKYSTQLAFTTGGTLRSPFPSTYVPTASGLRRPPAAAPWDLVTGDIFALLPFGNHAVTRTVTGTQLWAMLENGLNGLPAAKGRFPQISGFKVVYNAAAAAGSRVVSVKLLDNTDIPNDATTYTITVVDFNNTGGDGYTMLNDGSGTVQDLLTDVLFTYVDGLNSITPATDGRITAQ